MKRLSLLLVATLLAACSPNAPKAENTSSARQISALPLTIRTADGSHRFTVEVALTERQQERGLMFRQSIAPDAGMLFPMDPPRTASFWMKDTLIPLDMLFIHTDGSIAFLKANAAPYSREPVSAGIPVAAVLELRGGRAAELGIREGNHVQWGDCTVSLPANPLNFCPR